jgi:hypothetical protein
MHKILPFGLLRRNPNAIRQPLPRQAWSIEFKDRVGA